MANGSKLVLGFTNHYYTLWKVTRIERYGAGMVLNGVFAGIVEEVDKYVYLQNLSMDYDAAVAKITERSGFNEWDEDLDLRGEHTFERTVRQIQAMPIWMFTFGKLAGCDIRICTDTWQLNRAMNQEANARRRVTARRRLLELGALVPYKWVKYEWVNLKWGNGTGEEEYGWAPKNMNYIKPEQIARVEAREAKKSLVWPTHNDGEKITVTVKVLDSRTFESDFGACHIITYMTQDGKKYQYKGSTPPAIGEEYTTVTATVKLKEYKGEQQVNLQRVKAIKK